MVKRYLKNRLKRFLSLTGFTLVEIVIATVIIVIAITGILSSFIAGTRFIYRERYRLQAVNYATEVLEDLKQQVRADTWDTGDLSPGLHGPFNIATPPLSAFGGKYSYQVIELSPGGPKRMDITITWNTP